MIYTMFCPADIYFEVEADSESEAVMEAERLMNEKCDCTLGDHDGFEVTIRPHTDCPTIESVREEEGT